MHQFLKRGMRDVPNLISATLSTVSFKHISRRRAMRLVIFPICIASVASSRVDLSHQHHLGKGKIARSVGAAIAKGGGEGDTVLVDVSATILGDDGMSKLLQSIEERISENSGNPKLGLELRSNRITTTGATMIFNKILGMTKPTNETNVDEMPYVESLDMSLNDLETSDRSRQKNLVKSIEALVESGACPGTLRFDCCGLGPAACRSIGKGLLNSANEAKKGSTQRRSLRSLYLGSNGAIGDAGAAALAAALRTAPQSTEPVLEVLDLSACDISDAGCEALAMAIRDNPGCVQKLDISNNRITDDGAVSLALAASGTGVLASIDLSNNKEITDRGAAALATAIERGAIKSLALRSCSIKADGAEAMGTAICTLASSKKAGEEYSIDLSGNLFGIMKIQKKKGSASLLKSKASATTKAYMGFLGKKLRSGLNQAGMSGFMPSAESDDDEEELDSDLVDGDEESEPGKSGGKCGARAFADAIIGEGFGSNFSGSKQISDKGEKRLSVRIGMRHCFLDERAADALAAAIVRGRDSYNMDISCDIIMNSALDRSIVSALAEKDDDELISDMSDRYFQVLEALRIAIQRAREAAEAAQARASAENAFGSALGGGLDGYSDGEDNFFGGGDFSDDDGAYDEYDGADDFW